MYLYSLLILFKTSNCLQKICNLDEYFDNFLSRSCKLSTKNCNELSDLNLLLTICSGVKNKDR